MITARKSTTPTAADAPSTPRKMSSWEQAQSEFACSHTKTTLRVKTRGNGSRHFYDQCSRCGEGVKIRRKAEFTAAERQAIEPYDEELDQSWRTARNDRWQALAADERQRWTDASIAADARQHAIYLNHLESYEWARIRAKVLKRARNKCEGCAERPAVEIHHLTYKRLGDEMLFDLVAVCRQCHLAIHSTDQ